MIWAIDEPHEQAMEEVISGPDRVVAIVTAALVEDRLDTLVHARLRKRDEVGGEMFRSNGPLGTFSTKIDLAFLIGIYSDRTRKDLHAIRKIRNEFAHELLTLDFEHGRVRDLATNLTIKDRFTVTLTSPDNKFKMQMGEPEDAERGLTVREHFVVSC